MRTAAGWKGALSAQDPVSRWHHTCDVTPGILPFALRASLRLFKIAPGHFVEPADFIAKLAALVPKPRVNLMRYHGVFAPNSRHRAQVTPAKRGKGNMPRVTEPANQRPLAKRRASMSLKPNAYGAFSTSMSPIRQDSRLAQPQAAAKRSGIGTCPLKPAVPVAVRSE